MPELSRGGGGNGSAALPHHQLGEVLGRGAFGCVYRALNWQTGETVAVKQIALGNIPTSELPDIMSEIDLLKNLDHPNVVQYRGFVKTGDFLWIVLEYCENGSLTGICKKFGKFPESLCQIYICQVLEGLLYLHDQGVIHRDIKGSNILATKEGSVKLADFGVATRVGGLDRSVVGSPYWMAPEVVEQSGATTASDVWSVGCVVIELLEGHPPYHTLEPMPALFRIVNDDCPPLPDSASPVVRDFLLQCFQKDSNLRISARKLLKHPWMVSARRQLDQMKSRHPGNLPTSASRAKLTPYDETVQRVQEWNRALDQETPNIAGTQASLAIRTRPQGVRLSEDVASALHASTASAPGSSLFRPPRNPQRDLGNADALSVSYTSKPATLSKSPAGNHALAPAVQSRKRLPVIVDDDDEKENDNWDSDFEEGILKVEIAALEGTPSRAGGEEDENYDEDFADGHSDNSETIRPGAFSPQALRFPPAKHMETVVEDYSDLLPQDEGLPFEQRVANLQNQDDKPHKRILHPRDLSAGSVSSVRLLSPTASRVQHRSPATRPSSLNPNKPSRIDSARSSGLGRFSEKETDDYSDLFAKGSATPESAPGRLELTNKLSSRSWLGDEEADEDDPFAEVEDALGGDGGSDDTLEANVHREKVAKMCSFVNDLVDGMSAEADELAIRDGCIYLIDIFKQTPEVKIHFIKAHGLLTLVDSLQAVRSREVIGLELRIVNLLIANDPDTLEKLCLIGGCPIIMGFSHSRYPRDIRLEAALFIGAMCRTSLLTLQMFISCRGLRTLVDMMDENYRDQKDLVWMAVDGICRVFEMQGSTPRNDFCRMFAREGLLAPLSSALMSVADDDDDLAQSALYKIVHILLPFGQSDLKVKMELAQRPVILRFVRVLSKLPLDLLPLMLKTLKNISMAPAALEVLQHANAIEIVVKVMAQHLEITEICNPIVNTLYNLCRLSKSRQEEAALAGAVPLLQSLIDSNSPLKQFALPIICDFAHASKTCRKILWQHKVFDLYIGLLKDPFWSLSALESILSWMQDETARVEDALLEDSSIDAVMRTFAKAKSTSFENMLEPLLKILRLSPNLCIRLASQSSFFRRLLERLSTHTKAVVRLNLLRLVKALSDSSIDATRVAKQPNLLATISKLAEADPSLLVKNLAKEIIRDFADAEKKQKMAVTTGDRGPAAGMRRTWSDSAMSNILGPAPGNAAPRVRLKSRPHSPNLNSPTPSSLSVTNEAGLPVPSRRISIRAKTSPPR